MTLEIELGRGRSGVIEAVSAIGERFILPFFEACRLSRTAVFSWRTPGILRLRVLIDMIPDKRIFGRNCSDEGVKALL